jgi:galactosylceramidase
MNAASHRVLAQAALVTFGVILTADARGDQTITVSGSDTGRAYEGVGAVSGGGATSVLLRDYVEPQRTQILDYLFKPNFGAGMQELYVEIGGDGNSTEGSELSHMHTATDENYYRGYEWWLMEQAKARNPSILLDATAWSAPYWVGNDNYWSTNATHDAASYLANWILGAKSAHGLDINYIGCKNEPNFYAGAAWPELLRTTLNSNGLTNVGIHGLDDPSNGKPPAASMWTWASAMPTDTTLNNAFYAVSAHGTAVLPSGGNPPPANIIALNKPLWDTEEHPFNVGFTRATDIVAAFISNYVSGKITKTIYWFLVTAFYQSEPDYDLASAMVTASPWSGAYSVEPGLWGYAHIGQFTQPGWKFLDNASGNFTGGGNYATLASPNGTDYSVIAQTSTATSTQNITFNVGGGLSTGPISVWSSNATTQFQQQANITPVNGSFTIAMTPNTIYSLTTTTGQRKGAYTPPAASTFPFPYYENYDHYTDFSATGYRAYYHADIAGGFELYARPDGTGNCLRQVVSPPAQSWAPEWNPYTIVGDTTWKNYQVSADVSIQTTGNTTGWASIMGRVNSTGDGYGTTPSGYYMTLTTMGAWTLNKSAFSGATAIIKGQATLASGAWHNLQLVFQGTSIRGLVDGTQVFAVTDATYGQGSVGLGTEGGTNALFDNLIVNTVGGATVAPTVFAQDSENAADGGAPSDAGGSATEAGGSAPDAGGEVGTTPDGGRVADGGGGTGGSVAEGGGTLDGSGGSSGGGEAGSRGGSSNGGTSSSGGCACHASEIRTDEGEASGLLMTGSVLLAAGRRRRGRKASIGNERGRPSGRGPIDSGDADDAEPDAPWRSFAASLASITLRSSARSRVSNATLHVPRAAVDAARRRRERITLCESHLSGAWRPSVALRLQRTMMEPVIPIAQCSMQK